jgi:spermidine synthase
VLDLTDPDTPAFKLYSEEFFRMCQRLLKPGGMLTLHLGSPVFQVETVRKNAANLRKVFRHVAPMALYVPLVRIAVVPGRGERHDRPAHLLDRADRAADERAALSGLRYYHPAMHAALFTLPVFVQEQVQPNGSTGVKRSGVLQAA